jgi:signal peptidase I
MGYTEEQQLALAKAQHEFQRDYRIKSNMHAILSLLSSAGIIAAAIAIILLFILSVSKVYGNGMEPVMQNDHYVVANRLAYQIRTPQRGEVIIADGHIYRIIGMPGETVKIYGGHIYINNVLAQEEYLDTTMLTSGIIGNEKIEVGDNEYYVLCDNRKCFDDSRQGWLLTKDKIQQKVLFIF